MNTLEVHARAVPHLNLRFPWYVKDRTPRLEADFRPFREGIDMLNQFQKFCESQNFNGGGGNILQIGISDDALSLSYPGLACAVPVAITRLIGVNGCELNLTFCKMDIAAILEVGHNLRRERITIYLSHPMVFRVGNCFLHVLEV